MLRNPGLLSLGPLFHFVWFSLVTAPGYSSPSSPCYLLDLKQDHSIPGFQPPGASIRSRIQPGSLLGRAAAASPSSFPAHLSNRPAFSPPMSRALPLLPLAPIHHRIFPDFQTTLTYWPGSALWSQVCFLSPTSRISAWWNQGLCLVHAAFPAPSMVPDTQKVIKKGFLINRCYSAFIKEREEKVLEKKSSGRKRLLTMRKYNALNNMKICCERLQEACWISPSPPNLIFLNPSPLPPYRSDQQTKSSSNSKQTPTLNQP